MANLLRSIDAVGAADAATLVGELAADDAASVTFGST